MKIKPALRNTLQHWEESTVAKAAEWLPQNEAARGVQSPHFWIVTALMAIGTLLYYIDQTPLSNKPEGQSSTGLPVGIYILTNRSGG